MSKFNFETAKWSGVCPPPPAADSVLALMSGEKGSRRSRSWQLPVEAVIWRRVQPLESVSSISKYSSLRLLFFWVPPLLLSLPLLLLLLLFSRIDFNNTPAVSVCPELAAQNNGVLPSSSLSRARSGDSVRSFRRSRDLPSRAASWAGRDWWVNGEVVVVVVVVVSVSVFVFVFVVGVVVVVVVGFIVAVVVVVVVVVVGW